MCQQKQKSFTFQSLFAFLHGGGGRGRLLELFPPQRLLPLFNFEQKQWKIRITIEISITIDYAPSWKSSWKKASLTTWTRFANVGPIFNITVKELLFLEDFHRRIDWQISTADFTTTGLCKACRRLVLQTADLCFLGFRSISDFYTKMAVGKHLILRQFQTQIIKIKWFLDRILLYPNTDHLPISFLVV